MSLRLIPAGSVIEKVYYGVPDHYTLGDSFDEWDDAVRVARAKWDGLMESLTETMGGYVAPEEIVRMADTQVCIDLRWVIRQPNGDRLDHAVKRYTDVGSLRTATEVNNGEPSVTA